MRTDHLVEFAMPAKNKAETTEVPHRGIVRKVIPAKEPVGGDLTFTPDYTVTSTDDKGGNVLTGVEVILVFWGSFWSATPAPTPSRATYEQAIRGIVTGPYMSGFLERKLCEVEAVRGNRGVAGQRGRLSRQQ